MGSELTDFLTHRRSQISPYAVGLTRGKSRRTKGLTREDVAELTGVSFKWYTLFESGASKGVSRKLAERVASALSLSAPERHYMLGLLGFTDFFAAPPSTSQAAGLAGLIHQMETVAAALCSPVLEVLDCNLRFAELFPPPDADARFGRNSLWRLFYDRAYRAAWVDWPAVARRTIADFKYIAVHVRDTLEYASLRRALDEHEDFLPIWNSHEAYPTAHPQGRFELFTPRGQRVELEPQLLRPLSAPGLHLTTLRIVGTLS